MLMRTLLIQGFILAGFSLFYSGCTGGPKEEQQSDTYNYEPLSMDLIVGTYTRKECHVDGRALGLYFVHQDTSERDEDMVHIVQSGINPSYLAIDPKHKYVYAVNETGGCPGEPTGSVQAFSFDRNNGILKLKNSISSHGIAPCYISVTSDSKYVLVANYVSGTIAVFPVYDLGGLGASTDVVQFEGSGPDPRQEGPHAHFIKEGPDGFIYTTDLGTDSIRIFKLENGMLVNSGSNFKVSSGAGPRHIEFHPSMPILYVVNELDATIEVFHSPPGSNDYSRIQKISTLPDQENGIGGCADIHITPNGQYLYVSNRGDFNNLAIFSVNKTDGSVHLLGHQSTKGKVPRNFIITDKGNTLIVANQDSDNLVAFHINYKNGTLSELWEFENVLSPVCILDPYQMP